MRATEVGVRKVLGAGRKHLIRQFWIEAIFMSLLAMGFGIFLTTLLLPQFNALSGKQLSILGFFQGTHGLLILSIAIIAGILAGSYPALIMARFQPIDILKHRLRVGGNALFTKGLVVLQFALSGVLVISAVILGNQTRYMLNSDLGYEDEGLVIIRTQENEQRASEVLSQRFRNRLLLHSQIINVTASNREFGLFLPGTSLELQDRKINYRFNRVDPQFISTMGIELIDGTDFSPNLNANRDAVIVNRQFMQALGPSQSVGMLLGNASMGFPNDCRIIGVMEDCHFASLRSEIDPLLLFVREAFSPRRNRFSRIFVRIRTNQIRETIDFLDKTWKEIQPDKPFIFDFQDVVLKRQYIQEKRWTAIFRYSSLVSIIIACLGIFGLTAITLSRRVKEIGIRKVLGAKISQIVHSVLKDFVVLIAIANIVAWPIAYWVMKVVLQNYP